MKTLETKTSGLFTREIQRYTDEKIMNWHEIFRHINASWEKLHGRKYNWDMSARKILANAARKYNVPDLMAMWDIYMKTSGFWKKSTGGSVYGMVRDVQRILDHADFKPLSRKYRDKLWFS